MNKEQILLGLQQQPEIDPYEHDGCYELVKEVANAYAKLDDYSSIDYLDMNVIYYMTSGTWSINVEKKKEAIQNSHLDATEKDRLAELIDRIWSDACTEQYENCHSWSKDPTKPTFGLFTTPFPSLKGKVPDECAKDFVEMFADISTMSIDDEDAIFDRAEKVLSNDFRGMKAASASMVLHCLMPTVFPILNSNGGHGNIFETLGVELDKPKEVRTYISNCRKIKDFRDENLPFKNYRVADIYAWKCDDYVPSLIEYNPGITAEKYVELLQDDEHIKLDWLDTIYYIYLMGGEATCSQIAKRYGDTYSHYKQNATNTAKTIYELTNCPLYETEDGKTYWAIMFQSRDATADESGVYILRLRPELSDAIAQLDDEGFFKGLIKMKDNYNLNTILYGPPGTGKTYKTTTYAVAIIEQATKSLADIEKEDYSDVRDRYNKYLAEGRIAFTTFHQSYGYEEFIEGIKPNCDGSANLTYSIEKGVFRAFCEDNQSHVLSFAEAWNKFVEDSKGKVVTIKLSRKTRNIKWNETLLRFDVEYATADQFVDYDTVEQVYLGNYDKKKTSGTSLNKLATSEGIIKILKEKYNLIDDAPQKEDNVGPKVFIIDEINRGNISKIFGELITLIEPTKRIGAGKGEDTTAILPYSGVEFGVPNNVYILGTMNTADRSLVLMDTALRRRFSFIEMMPEADILRKLGADKVKDSGKELDVAKMLEKINNRIEFLFDREHTIGHAFFTGLKDDPSLEKLSVIFKTNIIPLLQEYFFEDYEKIQLVLGDNNKSDDDYKFITKESKNANSVFNGYTELDPVNIYKINENAFNHIESYIEI